MNILHTENSLGWGGQEIRILDEATGMIERGHHVELACPPEARIYAAAQKRGLPVTPLPIARRNMRGLLALGRFLSERDFEIINCHSSTDAWLTALACSALRQPPAIVRTRHISAPVTGNAPTRWLYRRAQRIVTTGEALRLHLLDVLGGDSTRIVSIPTGIDTEHFAPQNRAAARTTLGLPMPPEALLIGILATLRSWKGHADLIDAFATLPPTTHLLIIGDGPQRQAIKSQIGQHGVGARVHLVGHQDDVRPYLAACDLFALPSYANEGVPQALMQAMSMALPCVTTDIGGIPEVARHGETAHVTPPRNVARLAWALDQLLMDAPLRQKLGQAARQHVAAHFSRQQMLERMETVFLAALAAIRQPANAWPV